MTKREIPDKKAAALEATLKLISEQGFHGTPMSQIAKQANIGVGTIYRYFSSKEDLVNALYIDIKTRLVQAVLPGNPEERPVREVFNGLFGNMIRYFIAHPTELSFVEQYENSPLITEATRKEITRLTKPWTDLYLRARQQNLAKELPLEVMAPLVIGAVISLAKQYLSGAVAYNDELLAKALDAIWDMLKR